MVYIPGTLQNLNTQELAQQQQGGLPQQELLLSGGGSVSGAAPSAPEGTPQGVQQTAKVGGAGVLGKSGLGPSVLSPVQKELGTQQEALLQGLSEFRQAAGPLGERTYEKLGAEQTLQSALDPNAPEAQVAERIKAAQALTGAQYAGPTELTPELTGQVLGGIQGQQGKLAGYRTGADVLGAIQQAAPTLTPGEIAFEARALGADPSFIKQIQEQQTQAIKARSQAESDIASAKELGAARTKEEETLAEKSKQFLGTREQSIEGQLQQRIDEINRLNELAAQQYANVQGITNPIEQYGAASELMGLDPRILGENLQSGNELMFAPKLREQMLAADAARQEIMAKYPSIAEIDPLSMGFTHRGHRYFTGPGEELMGDSLKNALSRGEITLDEYKQLDARQRELEQLFSTYNKLPQGSGQYQFFNPAYFGDVGKFELPGLIDVNVPYLTLQEATQPSRAGVVTGEERTTLNRINEILGEVDRMAEVNPSEASKILFNAEQHAKDLVSAINQRKEAIESQQEVFQQQQKKTRKKAKKADKMATLNRILTGMATAGMSEIIPKDIGGEFMTDVVSPGPNLMTKSYFDLLV